MALEIIYSPVEKELTAVAETIKTVIRNPRCKAISEISDFLLKIKGKRIRPALVLLSAKAIAAGNTSLNITVSSEYGQLVKSAAALELIHNASLIHDDVMDHAEWRHNQPTVNSKWGNDVSIALGNYLYSSAFELLSAVGNEAILQCVSSATRTMCEGELTQVCERDNFELLKKRYIVIIEKKTASLFAASCQTGAMVSNDRSAVHKAFRGYGLNFGLAFQIVDDCLDLIGDEQVLGKTPGADFKAGELTLPILNLIKLGQVKDKKKILALIRQKDKQQAFKEIKQRFLHSSAREKTRQDAAEYVFKAKHSLRDLPDSCFRQSLFSLADYITERIRV